MILADLGAEVIKIEPPEGDESRHQKAYRYGDETAYYISANRNKRGIVLDLKRPEGRQVFYELVAHADVVVDNYRAQTLRRLGADYERLRQIKPDIICCSLTAFGDEGAAATRPGYDLVIQAMGGGMSLTGEPGRPPVRMGLPIGDVAGGMFAAHGILAALYERTRSGQGQQVSTTLLSAQIALHTYVAAYYWQSGQEPGPVGSAHASMVPYQTFRTGDGWIAVVAHTPGAATVRPCFLPPAHRSVRLRATPTWVASRSVTGERPGPCATAPEMSPSSGSPAPLRLLV